MAPCRRISTRAIWLALILALFGAACSGTTSTTISETSSQAEGTSSTGSSTVQEPEPTAEPAADPTPVPEPTPAPEPTATPELVNDVFWGSELESGMCINRLEGNPAFEPPDVISCDDFHEEEIYGAAKLDFAIGDPYPGEDELVGIVSAELCDEATIDFAGEPWDLVPFESFLLYPLEEEWDAGDRLIFCSAAPPEGVAFKIGTAAGGTIDTDDVLIARTGLTRSSGEFEDWVVITEHATIDTMGSLTEGQFDLPLRRPSVNSVGLVFSAFEGGEGTADTAWGIDWETQQFTSFGAFDDGSEFGSVLLAENGVSVLAAREQPDGDWDLWVADGDDNFEPLVAGEGDQHFPTFTPDQTQVVYQNEGDLWIVGVDGSDGRQLTSGPANDWESAVSPDGSTVIFASDRSGNDDIWSVSIDGGDPVNLTNHPGDDIWPIFNADGSLIYFSSDRLDPVDDLSKVMVMQADGSNQSWFAIVNSSQAVLVPEGVAAELLAKTPTLDERYNYTLIEGEPGTVTPWTHSSDRLTVDLPVGWRVGEADGQIGFLTAPRPSKYSETWAADGVVALLHEDLSGDEFFTLYDEMAAVQDCEQFDGTGEVITLDNDIEFLSGNFYCGESGAVGGVLMFYNPETRVGVAMEGQRDNLPDADLDSEVITAIARSIQWR